MIGGERHQSSYLEPVAEDRRMTESGMMDNVHLSGVEFIHSIQTMFKHHVELMQFLTRVGDPRYAFLIYFPVAFCLRKSTGIQVLWLACISEWMNAVLKWILHGERPYWWIHEITKHDHVLKVPQLEQYSLTCETGPGSPSGHAMVTSAVLYTIATSFLKHGIQNTSIIEKIAVWLAFAVVLIAVNISRLFIATHFPHQVVAGTIVGIILAEVIKHEHIARLQFRHYVLWAVLLVAVAALTFYSILAIGLNPFWSFSRAEKWCAKPEWVHPDTSPFWGLVRDISSLLGFGSGLRISEMIGVHLKDHISLLPRILQIIVSITVAMAFESIKVPHNTEIFFYAGGFAKYFIMMLTIVTLIPKLFLSIFPIEKDEKNS